MKKLFLVLGIVALVFSASSCNKQKKCQCSYTLPIVGGTYQTEVFLSEPGVSCEEYEEDFGLYEDVECHTVL